MDGSLIQALYEAAFDERNPHRLAELISATFGGRSSILHVMARPGEVEPISWSYFTSEIIAGFKDHAHLDPWTAAAPKAPLNTAVKLTDLVSTSTFQRSAFYNEFVQPIGDDTSYCMAAVVPVGDAMAAVALHRGATQGDFSDEQKQRLSEVMPVLAGLLKVRSRLEIAERKTPLLEATVDAWPKAILHVNQRRRLAYANSAGEALLREEEVIRLQDGKVYGAGPDAGRVQGALEDALVRGQGAALALRAASSGREVLLTVAPLYSARTQSTLALVSIDTAESPETSMEAAYMTYFGLTKAEAEIAAGLANGMSLEEISSARSTQIWTARTQLRTILQKTGARRQAQLVSMLKGVPRLPGRG